MHHLRTIKSIRSGEAFHVVTAAAANNLSGTLLRLCLNFKHSAASGSPERRLHFISMILCRSLLLWRLYIAFWWEKGQSYSLPWNEIHCCEREQMKSKLFEGCHSLLCSPTRPRSASDGEKLFKKHTHCSSWYFIDVNGNRPDACWWSCQKRENLWIGQTCLHVVIFMERCWSQGFHVLFHRISMSGGLCGWTSVHQRKILLWSEAMCNRAGPEKQVENSSREQDLLQNENMSGHDCLLMCHIQIYLLF